MKEVKHISVEEAEAPRKQRLNKLYHKKCTCLKLPATEGNLRQHFLGFFKKYGYV